MYTVLLTQCSVVSQHVVALGGGHDGTAERGQHPQVRSVRVGSQLLAGLGHKLCQHHLCSERVYR